MRRLARMWGALFESRRAGDFEPLLFIFLVKAMRDGLTAMTSSTETFRAEDAFNPHAIAVEPVGWVSWLPVKLVLSQDFERGVGFVVFASAALWLFKRFLSAAPAICAASYGILTSLGLSRIFNYCHENLVIVWVLIIFALVYAMRRRELVVQQPHMLTSPTYPVWAGVLIVAYLGFQYTYSGLQKLQLGGFREGTGLMLQLLLLAVNDWGETLTVNRAAKLLVEHRMLATLAMTSAIVLESGAIAALFIKRLRPWWALGLASMHASVLLTMHIAFRANILVLLWLAIPSGRLADAVEIARRLIGRSTAAMHICSHARPLAASQRDGNVGESQ